MERADTSMNIRMNREIKNQAQMIFSELGLDMTTAINVFLRQSIRVRGLPFALRLEEPNETTYAAMNAAASGKDLYGPFNTVEEMMEALNAEI